MNVREQGFLLLTGYLGDPERKPLTLAQFRELTVRARQMQRPKEERSMTEEDLISIGCDRAFAQRVLTLLSHKKQLQQYVIKGMQQGCYPLTRISDQYPKCLRLRLGLDAPGVLWFKGDPALLNKAGISLVGSRDIWPKNAEFAAEVGKEAARQGYVLISGNARGADRLSQEQAWRNGGPVISVVADALEKHSARSGVVYLAEEGYDLPFSAQRALQRNRIIHAMGQKVFVAQCDMQRGGTWSGTCRNLQKGWSPVFCFRDGSEVAVELEQMGATLITKEDLQDISALQPKEGNLLRDE